jgi:hypothetical protein
MKQEISNEVLSMGSAMQFSKLDQQFTLFLNIGNLILHEYHVTLDQQHV